MKTKQQENNSQLEKDNNENVTTKFSLKQHYAKNKRWYNLVIFSILLILIILSIARIPYVGQFIDSVIFSFILGYSKYFLYLYLIFFCCLKIFNVKKKPLYSKRFFIGSILTSFLISMLLGGVNLFAFSNHSIWYYIKNVWYNQLFDFHKFFIFGFTDYIDAGFIGAVLANIPGIFIIVLSLILLIILYFLIFSNHRKKVMIKLLKNWNKKYNLTPEIINKIKNQTDNQNNNLQTSKMINHQDGLIATNKQNAFNLNDNYIKNNINVKKITNQLTDFLKSRDLVFSDIKVKENDQEYIFIFNLDNECMQAFKQLKPLLSSIFLNLEYTLMITENTVYIKLLKVSNVINSSLKKYLEYRVDKSNNYALCLDDKNNFIINNFNTNNIIGLAVNEQEKYLEYINALISHLSINYNKAYFQIVYLSSFKQEHNIIHTQNLVNQTIDNVNLINKFLSLLVQKNQEIEKGYQNYHCENIDQLNEKQKDIYKKYFIILDGIDEVIKNKQVLNNLLSILKVAYRYQLVFILIDHSENIDSKAIIKYDQIISANYEQIHHQDLYQAKEKLYDMNNKQKTKLNLVKLKPKELAIIENKLLSIWKNLEE